MISRRSTRADSLSKKVSGRESRSPEFEAAPPAQQMLLDLKAIQDIIAAFFQNIPSLTYIVVSLVYAPLIFTVRESAIRPVWIVFCVQLILVGVVCGWRAANALRTRDAYQRV